MARSVAYPGERDSMSPAAGGAPDVSVVIPVHDEAAVIASVVTAALAHTPPDTEVLVVDDGSSDDSAGEARRAGAHVVSLTPNRGKGAALQLGIEQARGEVLVFIDGDGQDDPAEIPSLLAAMDDGVDMVIGSRFLGRFEQGAITNLNRLGTRALTAVFNRVYGAYGAPVTDPIAGFRAVRRAALAGCRLGARRYDIEVDVLMAVLERGGRVVEVPVARYQRPHGSTDLSSFRDGSLILGRIVGRRLGLV